MRSVIVLLIVVLTVACSLPLRAQVRITALERVNIGEDTAWGGVIFSPDGARLYLTPPDYRGIWEHTIGTGEIRTLTTDRGSGFGFALSDDGGRLAYRRTSYDQTLRSRRQELVVVDLSTGLSNTVGAGRSVGTPAFAGSQVIVRIDDTDASAPVSAPAATAVLGIEQMKIAVMADGVRRLLEPLGAGRYVWPVLSPDRLRLAAYELVQGGFVCTLEGAVTAMIGPYRAPAWTRDGRWIICMDDQDDGHRLVGSRLVAVGRDGGSPFELEGTAAVGAMYPACSPREDLIACVSLDGHLYLLRYVEEVR